MKSTESFNEWPRIQAYHNAIDYLSSLPNLPAPLWFFIKTWNVSFLYRLKHITLGWKSWRPFEFFILQRICSSVAGISFQNMSSTSKLTFFHFLWYPLRTCLINDLASATCSSVPLKSISWRVAHSEKLLIVNDSWASREFTFISQPDIFRISSILLPPGPMMNDTLDLSKLMISVIFWWMIGLVWVSIVPLISLRDSGGVICKGDKLTIVGERDHLLCILWSVAGSRLMLLPRLPPRQWLILSIESAKNWRFPAISTSQRSGAILVSFM